MASEKILFLSLFFVISCVVFAQVMAEKLPEHLEKDHFEIKAMRRAIRKKRTYVRQSSSECNRQRDQLRQTLRRGMELNGRLIAGFTRAGFHDCITAIPGRSSTGCNGSLRLSQELNNPLNDRMGFVFTYLRPVLRDYSCISFADAIQLGVEQAVTFFGGPSITGRLGSGRRDTNTADRVTGEVPNTLSPLPDLKRLYARKGFTVRELVVSNVGGHAVGRFLDQRDGREKRFTPQEFLFENTYAVNLVRKKETGRNQPGFNTLPSDDALIEDAETLRWLEFYSGKVGNGFDTGLGNSRLKRDFTDYLVKQSRL